MDDGWQQIKNYVRPDEHVLWVGRPDPAVRLSANDAFVVPFSLVWFAFTVFWETAAFASGAPVFFRLWGALFVGAGLYFVAGRFVVKARRKKRTAYALTSARAIVAVGDRSLHEGLFAYQPTSVRRSRSGRHVTVMIGSGGSRFRGAAMYANTGLDLFGWSGGGPIGFYDVADVDGLLTALDTARGGVATKPPSGA